MLSDEIKKEIDEINFNRNLSPFGILTHLTNAYGKFIPQIEAQEKLIFSFKEFYEKIRDNKYEPDKLVIYLDQYFKEYQQAIHLKLAGKII